MIPKDKEKSISVYRTPQFERCLDDLHRKGGTALDAAERIDEIFRNLLHISDQPEREQFRYTRNGEYRIRHCRKISLGCGYRLVLIQKDNCYVFLYAGSHDDCFRWIERNKGLTYEIRQSADIVKISHESPEQNNDLPPDVLEQRKFIEQHEEEFMRQLDENTLLKIFPGWYRGSADTKTS